jgi:hypothetical protein
MAGTAPKWRLLADYCGKTESPEQSRRARLRANTAIASPKRGAGFTARRRTLPPSGFVPRPGVRLGGRAEAGGPCHVNLIGELQVCKLNCPTR